MASDKEWLFMVNKEENDWWACKGDRYHRKLVNGYMVPITCKEYGVTEWHKQMPVEREAMSELSGDKKVDLNDEVTIRRIRGLTPFESAILFYFVGLGLGTLCGWILL